MSLKRLKRPNPTQAQYDPARRLLAAIALQAVRDACFPNQRTTLQDQCSARQFLADDRTESLFDELGISWDKAQQRLADLLNS